MSIRPSLFVVVALLCGGASALAGPVNNTTDGTTYATIQEAIDAAMDGDELVVDPGLYVENINFHTKAVTLRSSSGDPTSTVIDGSGAGSVVIGTTNKLSIATLSGFVIQNGAATLGGGIDAANGHLNVLNCIVRGNSANAGGGIYIPCGAPTISHCTFANNGATSGGAMFVWGAAPVVTDCAFAGNSADIGGAIDLLTGGTTLLNCALTGNTATSTGGAMCVQGGAVSITNCSLSNNTGAAGGGLHLTSAYAVTITNTILWGNAPDQVFDQSGLPVISYCDIQGGFPAGAVDGGGNISADPLFADADGPDNTPGTLDDDLRLTLGSPCIDAGNNGAPALAGVTTDLAGHPRFVDIPAAPDTGAGTPPIVDMGAFEVQSFAPPSPVRNITQGTGYPAIQPAVNAAVGGDVIEVDPGTYFENLFVSTPITLRSASGDPNDTIIDGSHAGTVIHCASIATTFEGFTITNGSFAYGGGMNVSLANPTVADCVFSHNEATVQGGAIFSDAGGDPNISGCSFIGNVAPEGGAIYSLFGDPTIANCDFRDNLSSSFFNGGGAIFSNGGELRMNACAFRGNSAMMSGAGVYCFGGSMARITDCSFYGNTASFQGAAIYAENSPLTIINCLFSGNAIFGGGSQGGALFTSGARATVTNSSFSENVADMGGAIFNSFANLTITNCVLWGNHPNQFMSNGGVFAMISFSDIQGGFPPNASNAGGNIFVDPLFIDADGPDNTPGTFDDNLRLMPGSPCIDAADSAAPELVGINDDLDGAPRFVDDPGTPDTGAGFPPIVDMGAYEFQGASPIQCACAGDLDGDCDTDVSDFAILAASFSTSRTAAAVNRAADLNADGVIDVYDFALLSADWGCSN